MNFIDSIGHLGGISKTVVTLGKRGRGSGMIFLNLLRFSFVSSLSVLFDTLALPVAATGVSSDFYCCT